MSKRSLRTGLFVALGACCALSCTAPSGTDAGADGGGVQPDASTLTDGDTAARAPHRVLFVGNSYVYVNDVPGHYTAIASAFLPDASVEMVAPGGYTFAEHARDARTDGTALARWLRTGTPDETAFSAVVLQEQSQVGGFPIEAPDRRASVEGALELAALARARGAAVVLYLTWGRERGDPDNADIGFGTFSLMQDRLDDAYVGLAGALGMQGADVRLAPVGGGFRLVFEDVTRAGRDPLAEGSDFDALYDPDGSHPSVRGAYLAACTIAATITGADPRGFVDEPALGADVSRSLRHVCARALVDPRWRVPKVVAAEATLLGERRLFAAFGSSVAVDGAGSLALVGASDSLVTVSVRASTGGSGWTEEVLWRDDRPLFGGLGGLALSADGSRAIVSWSGLSVVEYLRSGGTWSESGPLIESDLTCDEAHAIALSADGNRAFVGDAWCAGQSRPVRMLVRLEGEWVEEARFATDFTMTASGRPVALDAKGERAVLGGPRARIFRRDDAHWVEEEVPPVGDPIGEGVVAISGDGSRAAVGISSGARVVVLGRRGSAWVEEATIAGHGYDFGLALTADGRRLAVGRPYDSPPATRVPGSGSVGVYAWRGGKFREELVLVPREPSFGEQFGYSLAMSPDGTHFVVGAPRADRAGAIQVGAAYTFSLPPPRSSP